MGDLNQTGIYIGIDLCRDHVVLSYYSKNMTEPGTFSTVMGEDNYCLPLSLAKRFGVGQWFFGAEAKKKALADERANRAKEVEDLYKLAVEAKQNYDAKLREFLKDYGSFHLTFRDVDPFFSLLDWF